MANPIDLILKNHLKKNANLEKIPELKIIFKDIEDVFTSQDKELISLKTEKLDLINGTTKLNNLIKDKETLINSLINENKANKDLFDQKNRVLNEQLEKRNKDIIELNEKIKGLREVGGKDENLLTELENLRLRHEALKKEVSLKDIELVEGRVRLNQLLSEKETSTNTIADLKDNFTRIQEEKNRYVNELDSIKARTNASFTSAEMSDYFTKAIDSFREKADRKDQSVAYVINEMDVELKGTVAKNEANEMIVSAPSISNNETVSTIRFSIRAIPKTIEPQDS